MSLHADIARVEKAPLAERKASAEEFYRDMKQDPALIAERIDWLLEGHFGEEAYRHAREVLGRPRMNREAWLIQTIGTLEWSSPQRFSILAWKKLSPPEKARLHTEIQKVLKRREAQTGRDPSRAKKRFISKKIKILRHEGYPERQSIAIAYRKAGVAPRRGRKRVVRRRRAS